MAELKLQRTQQTPRVAVIALSGVVDYLDVSAVETAFEKVLQAEQPQHVVLDVSGLTFLVTPFLGSLLYWNDLLSRRGGRLMLCGSTPGTEAALRHIRLDRVIACYPDVATALAALR